MKAGYNRFNEDSMTLFSKMIRKHDIEEEKTECGCQCHAKQQQAQQERIVIIS